MTKKFQFQQNGNVPPSQKLSLLPHYSKKSAYLCPVTGTIKPDTGMEEERLRLAIGAALMAGRDIMEIYDDPAADFAVERKADNSPLTAADRRAHARIAAALEPAGLPVLSEEGRLADYAARKAWKALWIVDPLDGTKEFIRRNGEFTVNIALAEGGIPTLGVVYAPAARTLYFAEETIGAYKMGDIDHRSAGLPLDDLAGRADRLPLEQADTKGFVVVASRSHLSPETEDYIRRLEQEYGDVHIISCGSSLKICSVAEGAADVYPRFAPTMEWDTAAGHAIARAAGCDVYHVDQKTPLRYNKEDLHNPWFVAR